MEKRKIIAQTYDLRVSEDILLNIHVKKGRKSVLNIILLFALSIFLTPIIAFVYLVIIDESIPFGFIITCIVGFLTSGYLIKLYLWNRYGKEVFIIQKNDLIQYYDYKFFKDNYQKIHFNSIHIYSEYNSILMNVSQRISNPKEDDNTNSVICFDVDGKNIKSNSEIPIKAIIEISKHIENMKSLD